MAKIKIVARYNGTLAIRGYGLRQTRYKGEKKTPLHILATARIIDVVRSVSRIEERMIEQTRVSGFAKLKMTAHQEFANNIGLSEKTKIDPENPQFIITIHRIGYKFTG